MKHIHSLLVMLLLLALAPVWGEAAELKCGRFCLVLGDARRPLSVRAVPGGDEILNRQSPGAGFYLPPVASERR